MVRTKQTGRKASGPLDQVNVPHRWGDDVEISNALRKLSVPRYNTRSKGRHEYWWQNLYAALCNNAVGITNEGTTWYAEGLTWYAAGCIVAELKYGNCLGWSEIFFFSDYCVENECEGSELQDLIEGRKLGTVREGVVTNEIRNDLLNVGIEILSRRCEASPPYQPSSPSWS